MRGGSALMRGFPRGFQGADAGDPRRPMRHSRSAVVSPTRYCIKTGETIKVGLIVKLATFYGLQITLFVLKLTLFTLS
uniref:Uncharacterized protein n=1 Tax=Moorena producens (strain JHB) TaxID=1454205 RepID=A0A1D9G3H4_MOOP1